MIGIDEMLFIKKFEAQFGGEVFHEEPGERWIYEKDGRCYALPDNFFATVKQSIGDDKDYLLTLGTEITYDPEALE